MITRSAHAVFALALTACAGTANVIRPDGSQPLFAVRMADGARLDEAALETALRSVDVVYVGERHDAAVDHVVEAALVRLAQPDAVGMEMFQRPFQEPLDAYGRGEIDEATLIERTEWRSRWGMEFEAYAGIVRAGRDVNARIVALNAPREWTRAISRSGLEGLPDDVRGALPELDTTHAEHRAMVMEALSGHGGHGGEPMDPAMLERFYLAQVAWDETMGDTVAGLLAVAGTRVVVVAGRMHVQRGLGIPRTAARRRPHRHLVVLPLTESEIEAERRAPTGLCDLAIPVAS